MERIRIGNDIAISWALFENNGATHLINAGGASVSLNCGGYTYLVPSFSVQGNVVSFIFPAEDQAKTGKYKIVLTERNESGLVSSYDVRDAFVLVPENEMLNVGYTQQKNVEITSVITHAAIANIKTISIVESEEEGGDNVVTFVLTDGSQFPMTVKNGSKGDKGDKGDQGIQGEKGDKGDTGARGPAGIDSVEAAIGTNDPTQAPSVDKDLTEGVLSLTFNNIKGQKGDKGDQGNTGSSVDYPYELVNNVTTDDATKGLSAAQGVVLDGKISQLGQEVDNYKTDAEPIGNIFNKDTMADVLHGFYVSVNGTLGQDANCAASSKFRIKPNTNYWYHNLSDSAYIALFDENGGLVAPLNQSGGSYGRNSVAPNTAFKTPVNAKYAIVTTTFSSVSYKDEISIYEGAADKGYIPFSKELIYSQLPSRLLAEMSNVISYKANLVDEVISRNLFNKDNLVNGYINYLSGLLIPEPGNYYCSSLIPIKPNTVYYITYPTGLNDKYGRFVDAESNPIKALNPISGAEIGWDLNDSRAILSPNTAKYFQFTVMFNNDDSDLDTAQFELGDTPTTHVPYEEKKVLNPEELPKVFSELEERVDVLEEEVGIGTNTLELNFGVNVLSSIVSDFNESNRFKATLLINNTYENKHFNFRDFYLVNKQTLAETLVKAAHDDICPVNFMTDYLGGNHALSLDKISISNHNKTFSDIGSIWSDGTHTFVLVKVEQNYLYFVGENVAIYPSFEFVRLPNSGTLTHVSGATHTDSVSYSVKIADQWWPFLTKEPIIHVYLDNTEVKESGTYGFSILKISEDYEILNPASVIDKVKLGVGTFTSNPVAQDFANSADKMFRVGSVYTFNSAYECFVATSLCIYQEVANFRHFGFTQSAPLIDNAKFYIPKAKSKNNGTDAVDYRTIVDANVASGEIRANDYELPDLPPDRIITWSDKIGIQIGYLFDYGVGGNHRLDSLPGNTAMYIADGGKLYPYGWCVSRTSIPVAYSNKSAVCFRRFIDRNVINSNGTISSIVFEYNGHCYIYADFNAVGDYEIEIPAKYQGGQIEVLEKRDNVELLTQNASEKILIHVSQDDVMYGYFVGRINP